MVSEIREDIGTKTYLNILLWLIQRFLWYQKKIFAKHIDKFQYVCYNIENHQCEVRHGTFKQADNGHIQSVMR